MLRLFAPLLALAFLAGCGIDGPPLPPSDPPEQRSRSGNTQVTIGGNASIGVGGRVN